MTLSERLLKYKKESRTTYRELAADLDEGFELVYNFCNDRLIRMLPDTALKIDTYLKQKGY